MASRIEADALLGAERVERELSELRSQVQREKERVSRKFQELHKLLAVRELSLLFQLDEIVERVRRELSEKRSLLQQLDTAREGLERDLTENKLRDVLEKNVRSLEDRVGEVLGAGLTVVWVQVEWHKEGVERAVSDVCKIVCLKEKPVDYSLKVRPIWSRVTNGEGPDQISNPMQVAIDDSTQNIFVTDMDCHRIQVFDSEGKHLYSITDGIEGRPAGIVLTNEFIFVSDQVKLLKLNKSNSKLVKSVETENEIWGVDIDKQTNIYGCENNKQSVVVFSENLKFLKRIQLKSPHLKPNLRTHSIKLYQDSMYVMLEVYPAFHLQIFSLEGELMRSLIPKQEIDWSYYFCIDQMGNIIVADWGSAGNQIKIFNNEGDTVHTISNANLSENEKFDYPQGVALDKTNRIIVAQNNPKCCLQAF